MTPVTILHEAEVELWVLLRITKTRPLGLALISRPRSRVPFGRYANRQSDGRFVQTGLADTLPIAFHS